MPPRKRKPPATEKPPKKKTRADADLPDVSLDEQYQWQWEDKPGSWLTFDDKTQEKLTKAFNDREEEYDIDDEFVLIFNKPSRKTSKTGYQKRVRIGKIDKKSDNQVMTWSWQDGRKKRHYYSVASTLELENDSKSTSLQVSSEGKSYEVDVKNMRHAGKFDMYREEAEAKPAPVSSAAATPAVGTKAASSVKKAATSLKGSSSKSAEERIEKTITVKGKAPVDSECPLAKTTHVFYEGDDVWDCMLNQTNLQNNNNKYYIIQLLESDSGRTYSVWTRWGRVGKVGQNATFPCGPDLDDAKRTFCSKFKDKTKNNWDDRKNFTKVPGKYDLLEMDYDAAKNQEDEVDSKLSKVPKKPVDVPKSTLDKRVQELVEMICDVKAMEAAVVEMKYDAKKAPLGKLTKAQIKQGYMALKDIEELIKAKDFSFKLTEACNAFYTRIPHDFGMKAPEKITSLDVLKDKMSLLEALGDIEIAVNVLDSGDHSMNPVDRHYSSLECAIKPMDKSSDMYKMLEEYLINTHAATHSHYTMELLDIFELDKNLGAPSKVDHNKMLLWHGSRLTNYVGILAKGLRIAPPEAPVTGYMFGKGVYFADCASKSANYCFATKAKNVGIMLLNEVALGEPRELLASDYHANKLPKGKHSTKGCGKMAPDPATHITKDGVVIPTGKLIDTGVSNPSGYTLQYNEYIVYDTSQIKMKYLFKIKFNIKY